MGFEKQDEKQRVIELLMGGHNVPEHNIFDILKKQMRTETMFAVSSKWFLGWFSYCSDLDFSDHPGPIQNW